MISWLIYFIATNNTDLHLSANGVNRWPFPKQFTQISDHLFFHENFRRQRKLKWWTNISKKRNVFIFKTQHQLNVFYVMLLKIIHMLILGIHCVKSVRIQSFSTLYFPAFGLNAKRYSVSIRIQFECEQIRTRKTPNMNTFYAVIILPTSIEIEITWSEWIHFFRPRDIFCGNRSIIIHLNSLKFRWKFGNDFL